MAMSWGPKVRCSTPQTGHISWVGWVVRPSVGAVPRAGMSVIHVVEQDGQLVHSCNFAVGLGRAPTAW